VSDGPTGDSGTYVPGYFETRLAPNAARSGIWKHICDYLGRWIASDAVVLELGAGWCDFSNQVKARRVVAMDLDATAPADCSPSPPACCAPGVGSS
jgi:hypothetical protein